MITNSLTLLGQYIKDLSFENPIAPNLPSQNKNPNVSLDANSTYLNLNNNNHEINLKIKTTATIEKDTLFIIELQYAGLVKTTLKSDDDKNDLIVSASYLLFPFARSIISNITIEGGFKPFMIQPIKFENIISELIKI